jgi:hypothetical protein
MATMFQSGGAGRGQGNDPPEGRRPPTKGHYREHTGAPPKAILEGWKRAGVGNGFTCCLTCLREQDERHRAAWRDCPDCATHGNTHVGAPCPELLSMNDLFWRKHVGLAKYEAGYLPTSRQRHPTRQQDKQAARAKHVSSVKAVGFGGTGVDPVAAFQTLIAVQLQQVMRMVQGSPAARPSTSTPVDDRRTSSWGPRGPPRGQSVARRGRETRFSHQANRANARDANRAVRPSQPAQSNESTDAERRIVDLEAQLAAVQAELRTSRQRAGLLEDVDRTPLSGDHAEATVENRSSDQTAVGADAASTEAGNASTGILAANQGSDAAPGAGTAPANAGIGATPDYGVLRPRKEYRRF